MNKLKTNYLKKLMNKQIERMNKDKLMNKQMNEQTNYQMNKKKINK